ncbi:MAG: 2-hydroxychromene-2-carboxylate isomerase [Salinarimonadaceae bacterium]|nr:MAG: 2-hydroxychromene-2-carboxylate isomerase [Salinarimonadaceae bacterium]
MSRSIDYYFSSNSPWTFIGHDAFMEIAQRHALKVNYKPVALARIFPETGGLPLAERPPVRRRYRLVELQRWRDFRGLHFNVKPKHFPFDPTLPDLAIVALVAQEIDPTRFMRLVFEGVWVEELDLASDEVIAELLAEAGHDAPAVLAAARAPTAEAVYALNIQSALAADVFGAPSYVLDGEVFWGQDRLAVLDDALSSGRASYSSNV